MSVNTNVNKALLFDLLSSVVDENNFLIDIISLQKQIDSECEKFEKDKNKYSGLSEINKIILDNCYKFLLENQLRQTENISIVNDKDLFSDPKNQFDKNFKLVKENFESMITLKKPEEINFEDDEDDAMPPENLETIMNQTLADREKELQNITQKYSNENKKKAQDWINKDSPQNNSSNNKNSSSDDDTYYDEKVKKPKKKVSFEEPLESFNIFKKLKKKSNTINKNTELVNKIDTLIENQTIIMTQQNQILDLLIKKNSKDSKDKKDDSDD